MRITYKLTEKDMLEATSTKALRMIGFLLVAMGLLSVATRAISYPADLALVAIGLFFAFGAKLQLRASLKRDKRLQDQFEAVISEDFIEISSPDATSKYGWSSFTRYIESTNLFLLYQSQHVYNIFPKRAFTPEDLASFRDLLRQELGAASVTHTTKIRPRTWIFLAVLAVSAILLVMVIRNTR
jgi:hypothetical protein